MTYSSTPRRPTSRYPRYPNIATLGVLGTGGLGSCAGGLTIGKLPHVLEKAMIDQLGVGVGATFSSLDIKFWVSWY